MLKELLDNQRYCTEHFFENLDLVPIEKLILFLKNHPGTIFFTGVGKSGLVAKKIAYTMISTGTRAAYIAPIDALHGDLGMVKPNDTFILFSKSGESDELLQLLPAIRNKGAQIVGVLCNPHSRIGKLCHSVISIPFHKELCPFNMAPTTSTTSQLLFGDLLTIALMKQQNFTLDEYASNHPSGRIGKRLTFKVRDIMLTDHAIPFCYPYTTLQDSLITLSDKRCGCILIVDEQKKLLGIFTDGDLRRSLQTSGIEILHLQIQDLMNAKPDTITPDQLAWDAMKQMEQNPRKRITVLPVVDKEQTVVGLLHLHDILNAGL